MLEGWKLRRRRHDRPVARPRRESTLLAVPITRVLRRRARLAKTSSQRQSYQSCIDRPLSEGGSTCGKSGTISRKIESLVSPLNVTSYLTETGAVPGPSTDTRELCEDLSQGRLLFSLKALFCLIIEYKMLNWQKAERFVFTVCSCKVNIFVRYDNLLLCSIGKSGVTLSETIQSVFLE